MFSVVGAVASGIGSYLAANEQRKAAEAASRAQSESIARGLAFQQQNRDQAIGFQGATFDRNVGLNRELLADSRGLADPFLGAGGVGLAGIGSFGQAGLGALEGQQALIGLLGPDAQAAAIANLSGGAEMAALTQQSEEAILQNASATGGLRGGNIQTALADNRQRILSGLINQRFGQLGGIAGQGAQSLGLLGQLGADAARTQTSLTGQIAGNISGAANNFAQNGLGIFGSFGSGVTDLIGQQGAVGAGNAVQQGAANARMYTTLGGLPGEYELMQMLRQRSGVGLAGPGAPQQGTSYSGGVNPYLADAAVTNVANAGNAGVSRALAWVGGLQGWR